ncbi:hypothetical protein HDV05_007812 [Chytridiales sp. JEL 0842]|nr:hypothetical protein HDV05_007812 [Chytridiales sp. JEL 0842]
MTMLYLAMIDRIQIKNSQRSSDIFGLKESVQPRDVPSRRYRPDRNTSNVFGTNSESMSAPISTPKKDHMASDIFWNDSRSATASAVAQQERRSSAASNNGGGLLGTQVDYEPSFHAPGSAEMRRSARQSPPMSASLGGDYNDYASEPQQELMQQQYDIPISTLEKQVREYELATATPSNVPRTPQRQSGPSSSLAPSPRYSASKNHHYHSNVFDSAPAPSFVPSVNVHNGGKNNYVSNIFNTEPSSARGSVTESDTQKNGKRCYTQKNASSFGSSFLFSPQDELSASMRVAGRGRRSSDNVQRESTLNVFDRNATRDAEQSRRLSAYKNSNSSSMADIMSWSGDNSNNEGSLRRSVGGSTLRLDSSGGIRAGGLSSNDLNRDRQGKGRRSIGSMGSQGIF